MAGKWSTPLALAKRLAFAIPGLRGVDYGFRYEDGSRRKQLCIRFHVARKLAETALPAHEILPRAVGGLRCDVIQAAYAPHASPRAVCDPIQPGVSIGNLQRGSTGTLGALVRDTHTGRLGLLSNWHVLCASVTCAPGESICQPGPLQAGSNPARAVAVLERWLTLDQGCDAALALLDPATREDAKIFELGVIPGPVEEAVPGLRLAKMGAASGATTALVDGVDGTYAMDYSGFGDQQRWMDGIHLVREPGVGPDEISIGGDSGALWINPATNGAVALHFAGEDGLGPLAEYAVAHPLGKVLRLLDAELPA